MPDSGTTFPLTDRPWIQVLDHDGRTRLVSLRQLFAECDQLRALVGDMPTQTFAILRLLLAVLHRAVDGPADERAWRTLWTAPTLPIADVDDYLGEFRDRFDLLHPTTPFYQVADLHTDKGETFGLERMIADVPNGFPYLTSRLGSGLAKITTAEAARWLAHCQAFDTSGIKSGAAGDARVKGGKGYAIGTGLCGSLGGVFLEGQTLRETLLLNLIPFDSPYLHQDSARDAPVWERAPHGPAEESAATRGPHGVLTLYTWQSRRIRLYGDEEGITRVLVANGDKLEWENRHQLEPMTAWRRSPNKEKALQQPQVYVPALHDPARALWRGLDTLLPTTTSTNRSDGSARLVPPLTQWLARLHNVGYIDSGFRVTTHAVGAVYGTQQSVVDEVYHDALTMSVQAFDTAGGLRTAIVDGAADAEVAVKALRTLAADLCRAAGGSGRDSKDPPAAAGQRATEIAFAHLDQQFRRWLSELDPATDATQARTAWQRIARDTISRIGTDLVNQAGPAAWAGRRVDNEHYLSAAQADLWFRRALGRALPLAAWATATTEDSHDAQEVPA